MIYFVLPAYNEEDSILYLLPRISEVMENVDLDYKVVVCNDGSKDNTLKNVEKFKNENYPVEIINHRINRGLAETMRDLMEYVYFNADDKDLVVRMDCDDTHHPKYILKMLDKIKEGKDVVVASRFVDNGKLHGLTGFRLFLSTVANFFMKTFFYADGLQEYSCGYRMYKASIIKKAIDVYGNDFIELKSLGFACTLEKVIKLSHIGAKFGEIGFEMDYRDKKSDSKMNVKKTTIGYIALVFYNYFPFTGWRAKYRKYKDS